MKRNHVTALMYGWIVILSLIFISSILLTFFVRFTSMSEKSLTFITLAIGILSLFVGGLIAGIKGKDKGLFIGAFTGIGFTFLVFLVQYLGYEQLFTFQQTIHHLAYLIASIIGGI